MSKKNIFLNGLVIVTLVIGLFSFETLLLFTPQQSVKAASATEPVVAIHVSENTQSLDTAGLFHTAWWRYFVIPESLKVAFESDGTPYTIVTDAEIAAGELMDGTSPRYPIVFSLASEAITNNEIQPLRNYVNAGGFLFIGSSAYTRNADSTGSFRGNSALASEMGLNMSTGSLNNWIDNLSFSKVADHRLISHIPSGTLNWQMLNNAEEIVWATTGSQQLWRTVNIDAEILATAGGYPLIATKQYGEGHFIYHAIFNPIVGAGGQDSGMYAYTIYRNAVEWAFEAANLPIVKRSPWPYEYNAALMVRHDFENNLGSVASIQSSAAYEQSIGAKGEYYICTGQLRTLASGQQAYIDSMRTAVSSYGATIGSHNGGYFNPDYRLTPGAYDYWHWGPDTMIDRTNFDPDYSSYNGNGYNFAKDSIEDSFQDLEGWLAGTDNGRVGCGTAPAVCPRTWVSPRFDSGRDRSINIFEELGAVTMGEQKVSPFPHWSLSYDPANIDHRYAVVALPPSDWYVGSMISQSQEAGHTATSIQNAVDFYYDKGYLINIYGHNPSTTGNMKAYVDHATAKEAIWATNAVGIYDWWVKRDTLTVAPGYSRDILTGNAVATATISRTGTSDPQAAVEVILPNYSLSVIGDVEVLIDGEPAEAGDFRLTNYGVKVLVGNTVEAVTITYTPLEGWVQTNWMGGPDQSVWSDETRYLSATGVNDDIPGQLSLTQASTGEPIWSDYFNRVPDPIPDPVPLTGWTIPSTTPGATNSGHFFTQSGTMFTNTTSAGQVGFAYPNGLADTWTDYSIEADIKMPTGSTGGGGFAGRMNFATGTRYGLWIYPASNTLRIVKFSTYGAWNSPNGLGTVTISGIGTGWHHLKMVFSGANIMVYVDNNLTPALNITDPGTYGDVYTSGYVGFDFWTQGNNLGPSLNNLIVRDTANNILFQDNFGDDPVVDNLLTPPWTLYTGTWAINSQTLQSTVGGISNYANIYYNPVETWTDYSVQASVQFPSGSVGGGIAGRVNPTTGARYGIWVYPNDSLIRLIRWSDWDTWPLAGNPGTWDAGIPTIGTTWHTVKLEFSGSTIRVFWDNGLLIEANDSTYASGGISLDASAYQYTGAYLIGLDDVIVRGPAEYSTSGSLTSSAFDGGVGVEWHTVSWNAAIPTGTSICMRTRTADRADLLAVASWSDCYTASGSAVTSPDLRWIQYQVDLSTLDSSISPYFYESGITYSPGEYRPASYLAPNSAFTGESESSTNLSVLLTTEGNLPITGSTITFTLDGLAPVTGITNESGLASAPITLNLAPGNYPLTVTYSGDSNHAPIGMLGTFQVTNPWSEWIQDSDTDFKLGSLSGVDTLSQPGNVILLSQTLGDGEETGPFSLNGGTWNYRRKVYIDNPNATALPAGYSLKLSIDTASLTSVGKLLANGDDLRVVWLNEGTPVELDRIAETPFSTADTELWFRTQTPINATSRDSSYYIYYGNSAAHTPPIDPTGVFSLYDGFDDTAIDTNIWSVIGTITESGGWAHVPASGNIISQSQLTYGILEMRIQALAEHNYMWWGWEDGVSDAPNFIVFEEWPASTNFTALRKRDPNAYISIPLTDPIGGLTSAHTYVTEWRPGQARWWIDGSEVASATSDIPVAPMYANLHSGGPAFDIDWIRGRLAAAQEPVVALASTYTGYVSTGTYTSIPYDTTGAVWKYLVWEQTRPTGTTLTMRLRTAATQAALESAEWIDYPQSGMPLGSNHPASGWVQYQTVFSTTDALITPVLSQVIVYYEPHPTGIELNYFRADRDPGGVLLSWETVNEATLAGFNLYRRESGGEFVQVNSELIAPQMGGQPLGSLYAFLDEGIPLDRRYEYRLEAVETSLAASSTALATFWPFGVLLPVIIL